MKINQIIPVSGQWYAHFYNWEKETNLTWSVLCWALTDNGVVVGMVSYGDRIMPASDVVPICKEFLFYGYVDRETVDSWGEKG